MNNLIFTPQEDTIDDTLGSAPTLPTLQIAYMLTMSANMTSQSGALKFDFIPLNEDSTDPEGAFEISVYQRCVVTLVLDKYWNWKFRVEVPDPKHPDMKFPAVTLGHVDVPPPVPAKQRYWHLVRSADGMSVSFNALLLNDPTMTNRDPFNLYVDLQVVQPDETIQIVPLKVDPDIRNPGDPP